jgi:hypothetical protein
MALHTAKMKQAVGEEASADVSHAHGGPEVTQSDGHLVMFVKVRQVQDNLRIAVSKMDLQELETLTSGINPPCRIPSSARQARNELRPLSAN